MPALDADQLRLAKLLSRSALGDRPAFAELYDATRSKLFGVSLRIVRERSLAEEVLQDSFVSIWNHAGDYAQAKSAPSTWMTAIVRNRSLDILRRLLAPSQLPFIGVPKTIDNDVANTERAVGYSTAVAVATEALDRLQPTGASHERVMVLEVMGRDAGHIAIAAGIAGGADVVLIPEVPWRLERVVEHIEDLRAAGHTSALVVVAEAAGQADEALDVANDAPAQGVGEWLARRLSHATGAEARATVLGHVQRGAMPTAEDRLLASALGVRAVDLLAEGKADRMVAWWHRQVIDVPLAKVVGRSSTVDRDGTLILTARALGICLGDQA